MDSFDPQINRLWARLELYFDSSDEGQVWRRQYFINSTPDFFFQWLQDKVLGDASRHVPVARVPNGEMFLSNAFVSLDSISQGWIFWHYLERVEQAKGPAKTRLHPAGTCIYFKTVTLSTTRLKVDCECCTPRALDYYKTVLAELGACWPEAQVEDKFKYHPASKFKRRRSNADRDSRIFENSLQGKKKRELAEEFSLSEERIKQILREQRERDAG